MRRLSVRVLEFQQLSDLSVVIPASATMHYKNEILIRGQKNSNVLTDLVGRRQSLLRG